MICKIFHKIIILQKQKTIQKIIKLIKIVKRVKMQKKNYRLKQIILLQKKKEK